jgi:hypothetical protein
MVFKTLITKAQKDIFKSYFNDLTQVKITFKHKEHGYYTANVEYNIPLSIAQLNHKDFDSTMVAFNMYKRQVQQRLNDFLKEVVHNTY